MHYAAGDLVRNHVLVGMSVKHLGLKPTLKQYEQAVAQFWSMCLPRGLEPCSAKAACYIGHGVYDGVCVIRYASQNAGESGQEAHLHVFALGKVSWYYRSTYITALRRPHVPRKPEFKDLYGYAGMTFPGPRELMCMSICLTLQDPSPETMGRHAALILKMTPKLLHGAHSLQPCCFIWKEDEGTETQSSGQSTGAKAWGTCLEAHVNQVRLRQRVAKTV